MRIRNLSLFIVLAVLFASCQSVQQAQNPEEWSKNAVIYEVNVRQYTPQGTFNAFATAQRIGCEYSLVYADISHFAGGSQRHFG